MRSFLKSRFSRVLFVGSVTVLVFVMGFVVMGSQQKIPQVYADWTGGQCNQQGQSSQNCCNIEAHVRARTGWSSAPAGSCHDKRVYNCPNNRWVPTNIWLCPGDNNIVCCVPPDPAPPAPAAPPAPTNVTGSCSGTVFTVNWSPVSGQPYYYARIHDETTNTEGSYSGVITGSSFSFNNAIPGHQYSYWVHTTNSGGDPYSTEVPTAHSVKVTCTAATTKLNLDLLLHGIGKAGDNVKPGAAGGGNPDPKRKNRTVRIDIYNTSNAKVKSLDGSVAFNADSGSFKGEVSLGSDLPTGDYLIKIKFPISLESQVTGIQHLAPGTNNIPQTSFVTGDINHDGAVSVNVLDYNILITCFGQTLDPLDCSVNQKEDSDLFDNGNVDQFDFNLFIREITNRD